MNYRQAKRALQKKGTIAHLFFMRTSESKPPSHDSELPNELRDIITEFQDVFRTELPDGPLPDLAITHSIDTRDAQPVNKNPYPLSVRNSRVGGLDHIK